MRKFWDLLEESVIVRGIIALSFTACVIYLAVTGKEVPEWLYGFVGLILGFFFNTVSRRASK